MISRTRPAHDADLPRHSPRLLRLFTRYVRRYVGRRFNAVRVLRSSWPALPADQPVICYSNHPGWWDPLILMLLATQHYPQRKHFAPIDEAMLGRYAFFARLGFFGVQQHSRQGAAQFLRAANAILARPDTMLWITAEGHFNDVRPRPLQLRPGVAHLAQRAPQACIVPLAVEYSFWHESTPEALLAFGEPVTADDQPATDIDSRQQELTRRLEAAMDKLAAASCTRDAAAFDHLLIGRRGVGGVYDLWRRVKAAVRLERFEPAHAPFDSAGGEAR